MHIIVYCPSCQRRYQLDPSLRGQRIYCPNAACREVFEVREAGEAPEPSANGGTPAVPDPARQPEGPPVKEVHHSGSVGDLIPFLDAEEIRPAQTPDAEDLAPPPPTEVAEPPPIETSWRRAPPPVRQPAAPPVPPQREAPASAPEPDKPLPVPSSLPAPEPVEEPPAPPPVRRPPPRTVPAPRAPDAPLPVVVPEEDTSSDPTRRRRARRLMIGMILFMLGAFGGVGYLVITQLAKSEAERFQLATEEFTKQHYGASAKAFRELAKDYPESPHLKEYQFLADLSNALQPAREVGGDPREALETLDLFLKSQDQDALVHQYQPPIREAFVKISSDLAEQAGQALPDFDKARRKLQEARQAQDRARQLGEEEAGPLAQALTAVDQNIRRAEERQKTLDQLARLEPTAPGIRRAQEIIAQEKLADDPQTREVLERLQERFLAKVTFTPASEQLLPQVDPASERGLVVVPPAAGPVEKTHDVGVAFALARGVLYALDQDDGRFLWAARVGIDTSALPVRLPAGETTPEIALVLSSDHNTLTARDVRSGRGLWRLDLQSPCLGRPVLVDQRAYVPTYDGKVFELEVLSGRLLGWFSVPPKQHLTLGGVHQEGTDLMYFPADSQYVYVFDVKQHRCVGILQSDHPSGALRGAPLLVTSEPADPNAAGPGRSSYLILNQTDGLNGMQLRAFPLPLEKFARTPPEAELRVPGWSWFAPPCDGERIALATDAGVFSLVGINQPRNLDSPLFRLLPRDRSFDPAPGGLHPGRAQVVHAEENNFWVLMEGKLLHLQLAIDRDKGLQVTKAWELPAPLGWPLHAGQVNETRDHLFIVTQRVNEQVCLATAVDSRRGVTLWQRRLGMVCPTDPLVVGGQVVALDQEAGLYVFDPAHDRVGKDEWQVGGRLAAPPLDDAGNMPSYLVPAPDGRAVYAVSCPQRGTRLVVRRFEPGKETTTKVYPLSWRLAGTPAVGLNYLILPLAGGSLLRLPLDGEKERLDGQWLGPRVDRSSVGHVVYLGTDLFLTTDGSRGLSRWAWFANGANRLKSVALPGRIVGAPVLSPVMEPDGGRRVAAADTSGAVHLLDATDLSTVRTWQVGGQVTAGPYVAGGRIGCVVDRRRLVWIDPERSEFWQYDSPGEGIVGRPQLVGDVIVVADLMGTLVGLNPADGTPRGAGYTFQASVSPAAAPVAFGTDQVLVPLTDGTVLLLSLNHFRAKDAEPSAARPG